MSYRPVCSREGKKNSYADKKNVPISRAPNVVPTSGLGDGVEADIGFRPLGEKIMNSKGNTRCCALPV